MDEYDQIYNQIQKGAAISFWDNIMTLAAIYGDKSDLIEYLFEKDICYMCGPQGKSPMEVAYELNDNKTFELLADLASRKYNLNECDANLLADNYVESRLDCF